MRLTTWHGCWSIAAVIINLFFTTFIQQVTKLTSFVFTSKHRLTEFPQHCPMFLIHAAMGPWPPNPGLFAISLTCSRVSIAGVKPSGILLPMRLESRHEADNSRKGQLDCIVLLDFLVILNLTIYNYVVFAIGYFYYMQIVPPGKWFLLRCQECFTS